MNKKIKKAAAIVAAAVLCLSMSMSVFAAESPSDPDINTPVEDQPQTEPYWAWGTGKDANGNTVTVNSTQVSAEVEKVLKDEAAVKDMLTDAGYAVPENSSVVLLGMGDFKLADPTQDVSAGVDMTFMLGAEYTSNADNLKDLNDGDIVYLLHQKADGTWEVIEGSVYVTAFGEYMVKATMTGFSPIGFIKVMSNGDVVVLDKNENVVSSANTSTGTTVKTSPKTGE